MTIEIQSLTNVLVDGQPQGGVVDVLFNAAAAGNEAIRAPMLDALNDLEKSLLKSAADALEDQHKATIEAKDTANEATIAKMKEDADIALKTLEAELTSALTSQKIASDIALQETQNAAAQAAATAQAVFDLKLAQADKALSDSQAKALTDFAAQKTIADDAIGALKDALASVKAERDELTAKLVSLSGTQSQLAGAARQTEIKLRATLVQALAGLDEVKAISDAANQTADERAKEQRAAQIAAAEDQLAKLKAEIA